MRNNFDFMAMKHSKCVYAKQITNNVLYGGSDDDYKK